MIPAQAAALLLALNSRQSGSRGDWVLGRCPLGPWNHSNGDAHPSFGILSSSSGLSICKCQSCGFGGDLMDLLLKIQELMRRSPASGYDLATAAGYVNFELSEIDSTSIVIADYGDVKPNGPADILFPEEWLSSFKHYSMFPAAVDYLHSRGVSSQLANDLDVRFDPIQYRVVFPYRSFGGRLLGAQGRYIGKDPTALRYLQYGYKKKYNSHVWMGENAINLDLPVVLVEGPFDLASVRRVYPNVLASFTSGLSLAKLKRIEDAVEVFTFYDHGSGGNAARASISDFFYRLPVSHLVPTEFQGDPGAMSAPEVISTFGDCLPLLSPSVP